MSEAVVQAEYAQQAIPGPDIEYAFLSKSGSKTKGFISFRTVCGATGLPPLMHHSRLYVKIKLDTFKYKTKAVRRGPETLWNELCQL
jgi:hypothetical protein